MYAKHIKKTVFSALFWIKKKKKSGFEPPLLFLQERGSIQFGWLKLHKIMTQILTLWDPIMNCHISHIIFYFLRKALKGVLHLWALFLKTLWIFSKNKATLDKVSHGPGQKYSKELQNHSFTSVETIVVKLQWKMCENQYFPCFEP